MHFVAVWSLREGKLNRRNLDRENQARIAAQLAYERSVEIRAEFESALEEHGRVVWNPVFMANGRKMPQSVEPPARVRRMVELASGEL